MSAMAATLVVAADKAAEAAAIVVAAFDCHYGTFEEMYHEAVTSK